MTVLREQDIIAFFKKQSVSSNGLLIFGNDASGISSSAARAARLFAAEQDALRLDASSFRDDAALLDAEFRSMSLLGDRRLIIVEGCEEAHAKILLPVIEAAFLANFVIIVAGSLNKSSKLRDAATNANRFAALAVYQEDASELLLRLKSNFVERALTFDEGVIERIVELVGSDRGQAMMEVEKLALFCWPSKHVTLLSVEASCGSQASHEANSLIAAIFDGETEAVDSIISSMCGSGDWRSVTILLLMHIARLAQARAAVDRGMELEAAFRSLKPPVFFNQKNAMTRQVRLLSLADLEQAQASIQASTLSSRQISELAEQITSRAVLSLARLCRQRRSQRLAS